MRVRVYHSAYVRCIDNRHMDAGEDPGGHTTPRPRLWLANLATAAFMPNESIRVEGGSSQQKQKFP